MDFSVAENGLWNPKVFLRARIALFLLERNWTPRTGNYKCQPGYERSLMYFSFGSVRAWKQWYCKPKVGRSNTTALNVELGEISNGISIVFKGKCHFHCGRGQSEPSGIKWKFTIFSFRIYFHFISLLRSKILYTAARKSQKFYPKRSEGIFPKKPFWTPRSRAKFWVISWSILFLFDPGECLLIHLRWWWW